VSTITCHTCHEAVPSYDTVSYGSIETGYRELCSRCFNEEVAGDLDFEHVGFEPVDMADAHGASHRFHFRLHHLGDRVRGVRLHGSEAGSKSARSSIQQYSRAPEHHAHRALH
jgi:hypothetical protein